MIIDTLSEEFITTELNKAQISLPIKIEKEVASTNTLLRQYADAGEMRDMLLLAECQRGGRGRKGRSFFSPDGTGLYMSLLLHPKAAPDQVSGLTALAAAATARALETVSGEASLIKWVNDIWMRGKKCAGILTESAGTMADGRFSYVIVGIGINVYEPEGGFPGEISETAGAVFAEEAKKENTRNRIAVEVVRQFMAYYQSFPQKSYLEEYRSRSFLIGREVKIIPTEHMMGSVEEQGKNSNLRCATVLDIDDDCGLVVRYADGRMETLSSGEVSIRPGSTGNGIGIANRLKNKEDKEIDQGNR